MSKYKNSSKAAVVGARPDAPTVRMGEPKKVRPTVRDRLEVLASGTAAVNDLADKHDLKEIW